MRTASQYVVLNPCMLPSDDDHRRSFSGPERNLVLPQAYLPQDKGCCEGPGQPRREGPSAGPEGAAAGEEFCCGHSKRPPAKASRAAGAVRSTHALRHVAEPW